MEISLKYTGRSRLGLRLSYMKKDLGDLVDNEPMSQQYVVAKSE